MSTLVYMKMLEQTPAKYDRGMRLLTLGCVDKIKKTIASSWIGEGDKVLEIGCGTGSLARMMTDRGASVTGIDISEPMLLAAREAAPEAEFIHMTATEIERLGSSRFDRIVATLSLSELSETEVDYVLRSAVDLLSEDGLLIIADEVRPKHPARRIAAFLIRFPLAAVTFLMTQTTTHALIDLEERLDEAGFRVRDSEQHLMGTLSLFIAEKKK